MGLFKWFQRSQCILPSKKKVGGVDTVVREHMLSLHDVEVHTLLDHLWLSNHDPHGYSFNMVDIFWERPNNVVVRYSPTGKVTDTQSLVMPYEEFVERIKSAFFG